MIKHYFIPCISMFLSKRTVPIVMKLALSGIIYQIFACSNYHKFKNLPCFLIFNKFFKFSFLSFISLGNAFQLERLIMTINMF